MLISALKNLRQIQAVLRRDTREPLRRDQTTRHGEWIGMRRWSRSSNRSLSRKRNEEIPKFFIHDLQCRLVRVAAVAACELVPCGRHRSAVWYCGVFRT